MLARFAFFLEIGALSLDVIGDAPFDGRFRAAVGVRGADGAMFGNRDHVGKTGGISVDGGGGRKDDVGDIVLGHGFEQADGAIHIGVVVFEGLLCGFAHGLRRV